MHKYIGLTIYVNAERRNEVHFASKPQPVSSAACEGCTGTSQHSALEALPCSMSKVVWVFFCDTVSSLPFFAFVNTAELPWTN